MFINCVSFKIISNIYQIYHRWTPGKVYKHLKVDQDKWVTGLNTYMSDIFFFSPFNKFASISKPVFTLLYKVLGVIFNEVGMKLQKNV